MTPGITAQEYHERRAKLAASLPDNSIAIIAGADLKWRSNAVFYEFHQESNFLYLTGFIEPEACAVIQKGGKNEDYTFHLFVRPKDPKKEQWDGARSGEQAALDVFNADYTGDIEKAGTFLSPLIARASEIYTDVPGTKSAFAKLFGGKPSAQDTSLSTLLQDHKVKPLKSLINSIRVFKSPAEVRLMRLAGKYSGRAYTNAMRQTFSKEKDLWNYLEYDFRKQGCEGSAYLPVVAGGENALSIHYVRNDDVLENGQMVLVDAGGEYGGYITDITRTWPVNGKFTPAQKDLYEMILKVQRSSVALCRASAGLSLDKIHAITEAGLKDGLKALGFDVSGHNVNELFPHHVGHYIGLDVHDCPGYTRTENLRAGQCVTMEPGIYVPNDEKWPAHFRGLGIRIEDSVCVEDEHPLVLTTEAVKEVADIEALRD